MCGIECYMLNLTPEPECNADDLDAFCRQIFCDHTTGIKNGGRWLPVCEGGAESGGSGEARGVSRVILPVQQRFTVIRPVS